MSILSRSASARPATPPAIHFGIGRGWARPRLLAQDRAALIVLVVALAMRGGLAALGWPAMDSDEGTWGIMALHIARGSAHPVFFYGQHYRGALEAYLAAGAFRLFGPSLFALRLGTLVLAMLFLASLYALARLLYSPSLALFALVLLAAGPPEALFREIFTGGGYAEVLLCGTLSLLLAIWLARTSGTAASGAHGSMLRLGGFAAWGVVAGVGVWSDALALPFVLVSGVVLAVFCRREWRTLAAPSLALGLLVGLSPLLAYAAGAPDHNPLAGALAVSQSSTAWRGDIPALLVGQVAGTLLVALPTITGGAALCPLGHDESWPLAAHASPHVLACTAIHGAWSVGYLALVGIALAGGIGEIRALRGKRRSGKSAGTLAAQSTERRAELVRESVRLALLVSAALALLLFATSPVAARAPHVISRYLIGLLPATPAVLAPLWRVVTASLSAARGLGPRAALRVTGGRAALATSALALVILSYTSGLADVFAGVPAARAENARTDALAANLLRLGATRIYSEYWTCGKLAFASRERIICAALDPQLGTDLDRYTPYRDIVRATAAPAYVFPLDSKQARAFAARVAGGNLGYERLVMDGYVIYRPAPTR